jgi:hypothetical protein
VAAFLHYRLNHVRLVGVLFASTLLVKQKKPKIEDALFKTVLTNYKITPVL